MVLHLTRGLLALILLTSPLCAQRFDGEWFKVRVSANGVMLADFLENADVSKGKVRGTAWIGFEHLAAPDAAEGGSIDLFEGQGVEYRMTVVTEIEEDGYFIVSEALITLGAGESLGGFAPFVFSTPKAFLSAEVLLQLKSKLKGGELRSASLFSRTATLGESVVFDGEGLVPLLGDMRFKGRRVKKLEKLPFDPETVLPPVCLACATGTGAATRLTESDG